MIPKLICRKCSGEIATSEKFCSACGTAIEWSTAPVPGHLAQQQSPAFSGSSCSLCGQTNSPGASSCNSCGAALSVPESPKHSSRIGGENRSPDSAEHRRLHLLQSWKLPAGVAILFALGLATMRLTHKDVPPAGLSQTAQGITTEIGALQKAIEADPKNGQALLRLANLYYDTRAFARAIMMYDRYLEINPANPDALVDLATSYIEMALIDSTNRNQYFATAKDEMKKALAINPRHQLAHFNLGIVSLHAGDIEVANGWFRKCATIDSNSQTGRRALQLVKQHSFSNPS